MVRSNNSTDGHEEEHLTGRTKEQVIEADLPQNGGRINDNIVQQKNGAKDGYKFVSQEIVKADPRPMVTRKTSDRKDKKTSNRSRNLKTMTLKTMKPLINK
uniref:Uncharacterized protein n=1 Tax=Romanomermis culicivorax TaxID=13658 RepID=A0A915JFR2_ROMCU